MKLRENVCGPWKYSGIRFLIIAAVVVAGCHHPDEVTPTSLVLLHSSKVRQQSLNELQFYLGISGLNIPSSSLKYGVILYKVEYATTLNGQSIKASGLVALPETTADVGMISFQHGTIASHSEAPSVQPAESPQLILYSALASPGFIAVIPDYIGFGSSSDMLHPYFVRDATTTAVIDLLEAAKELAVQKGVNFNKNLFLAGYSEGGYATMATHRAIEQTGLEGFKLIASFPAAGGYDVKGMQEYFFGLTTYDDPYYMAFIVTAYHDYYHWPEPLATFFKAPYAGIIPGLFDGSNNGSEINAHLPHNVADLLDEDLRSNIDIDDKYGEIVDAFNENSLLDWTPRIRMFMYHGDTDQTVPYQNSVDTYNVLISNGASTTVVTLTAIEGEDHTGAVNPYIEDIIPKILSMQ